MINYAFQGTFQSKSHCLQILKIKPSFYEILKDLYDLLEELSEYKVAFEKLAQTLKENSTTLRKTLGLYHAKKCIEVDLDVEIENLGNC